MQPARVSFFMAGTITRRSHNEHGLFDHIGTRPMLGFRNSRYARIILGGIEFMNMIVKGQMKDGAIAQTPAQKLYSFVYSVLRIIS